MLEGELEKQRNENFKLKESIESLRKSMSAAIENALVEAFSSSHEHNVERVKSGSAGSAMSGGYS